MRRILLAVACLLISATGALASGIGGHAAITFRGGLALPTDQRLGGAALDSNIGYAYGGGILYGVNNNVAAEVDVTHSSFNADNASGQRVAKFNSNDISVGGHYRFIGTAPMLQKVVPYIGAGVDVILPEAELGGVTRDVDLSVGANLKAGADLFVAPKLALNLELKGLLATESDIRDSGVRVGKFDPSTVLLQLGLRVLF